MALAERMEATKGAVLSLTNDAYQRRDRVGLVVFQKDQATLILPPTNSTELAKRMLKDIPTGGKTPLSAGLSLAYDVIRKERITHQDDQPLLILLTDGIGNVSMTGLPPHEEALKIADQISENKIQSVVINTGDQDFDRESTAKIARHLNASWYDMQNLNAEAIVRSVKDEIEEI
jgi:magnesium chelatase subunit D